MSAAEPPHHYDLLLSLDDGLRALADAPTITQAAATRLGQYLQVNRCAYAHVHADENTFNVAGDYNAGVVSIVGRYAFSDFGAECLRLMRAGQPYVVEDSELDPRTARVRDSYRLTSIRAVICVPLLKSGRFGAAMAVHQTTPRRWRDDEVELVQRVASRCWESIERSRVTQELREARDRLQQINTSLEAQVRRHTDDLSRSERQFAQLVEGVTDCAIFMLHPDGRVANWNPGAARIKGYHASEIVGSHFSAFYTPEDQALGRPDHALQTARETGKFEGEGWRMRKDGSQFWASVLIDRIGPADRISGYAKITRDMTERRALQEQLNQSQKMEAIGQLTGGVAHDFNNLLTVILGNLDTVLRRSPPEDAKLRRAAENATRGAEKAAALTHQLLAFSRRQPLNPKLTNVNTLARSLLDMMRRTLPETVELQSTLMADICVVDVDPNQLENALLNLALNARDAMNSRGTLTLQTNLTQLDARQAQQLGDIPAGEYVVICVHDTGSGMTPEVMARAFDPFFTTKPLGQGTGLGLSQVFGFVKQSGGHVKLESTVGRGTTVNIYLPRIHADAAPVPAVRSTDIPRGTAQETVLVVEDEDDVRAYSVDCLEELGFSVLQAKDAATALHLIAQHPDLNLLFTDVGLPGVTGRELAEQAWKLRPTLPVLFTTGYAQDANFLQGTWDMDAALLTKPFNRAQLAERVRNILDVAAN